MCVVNTNKSHDFFKKEKIFYVFLLSSSLILNSSQPGESRPHHSRVSLDFVKKKAALHSKKMARKKAITVRKEQIHTKRQAALHSKKVTRKKVLAIRKEQIHTKRQAALHSKKVTRKKVLAIRKEQIHAKRLAYHKSRQAKRNYIIKRRAGHRRPVRITLTQQIAQLQVQLQQARLQLQKFFVEIRQEIRRSQVQSPIRPPIVLQEPQAQPPEVVSLGIQEPPTTLRTSPMTKTTLRSHAAPTTRSTLAPTRTFTETTAPTTTTSVAITTPVPITSTTTPTTEEPQVTITILPEETLTLTTLPQRSYMDEIRNFSRNRLKSHTSPATRQTLVPTRTFTETTVPTTTTSVATTTPVPITLTAAPTTIETSTTTIPRADVSQIEETTTTPISTTPTTDQRANLLQSLQQGFSPSPDGTLTFRGLRPSGNRRLREEPLQPQQENTMDAMISIARASTQSVGEDRREEEGSWSLQSSLIIPTEELALPTIEILPETPLISNRPRVTNDNSFNIDAEDRRSIEPIIQASEGGDRGDETRTDMREHLQEHLDRNIRPFLTDSVASSEDLTWSRIGREEEAQNENLANRQIPLVHPNLRSSLGSEEEELLDPQI
jgi:hypothetical protein